ncbi:MAG: hypothetical protein OXI74_14185 [Rhodospirillaceae bacterium]|nr:hypothetical protein [Rhodospirillaceae bacterium]
MPSIHDMRMNGSRRESGRRTPPWIMVLILALVMFLASIALTITVALILENRIATIESFLRFRE